MSLKIKLIKSGKLIAFITCMCLSVSHLQAQNENLNSKLSFGFQLNQYQQNFGFGLNVTSPYFYSKKMAIRLRGNLMWNEYVKDSKTTWSPYSNLSLGFVGVAGEISNFLRLYGEGGTIVLLPSTDFSKQKFIMGGYGLFGFEFFMNSQNNYFIEIGGVGTGAVADKIDNSPIYSNGLLINVGFRHHF